MTILSVVVCVAAVCGTATAALRASATVSAVIGLVGCPRAHCDGGNTDLARVPVPAGNPVIVWQRSEQAGERAGSRQGLGCSANGTVVACTYNGEEDNLAVYDFAGARLWSSGTILNANAFASAPIVLADGSVIACDDTTIVRFTPGGDVMWQAPLPHGGIPISPVLTADGRFIVLATYRGPLYAFASDSGALAGVTFLRKDAGDPGYFDTVNTPAVRGNRIYVVGHHQVAGVPDPEGLSWLAAVDVAPHDTAPDARFKIAWQYGFTGPSGASPTVVGDTIFFDGGSAVSGTSAQSRMIAVRDTGTAPAAVWQRAAGGAIVASYARDPRPGGSFWMYTVFSPWLVRRAAADGAVAQGINLDQLIDAPGIHVPLSAITIGGSAAAPVLIVSATAFAAGTTYIAAIDLTTGTLRWKVPVDDIGGWYTAGQFPMLWNGVASRVVFTTFNGGARAIGGPS
jgi:outer membrane protein assembly factor BamB